MDVQSWWAKLVEILQLGKRSSFILAGSSWLLLLLPDFVRAFLGLDHIWPLIKTSLGGVAYATSAFLLLGLLYDGIDLGIVKYRQKREIHVLFSSLRNLSGAEKKILRSFIELDSNALYFEADFGIAQVLANKNILYQVDSNKNPDPCLFIINDGVFRYLKEHTEPLE